MTKKYEPIDFRYDEGFRGRVDEDIMYTLHAKGGGGLSKEYMVKEIEPKLVGGVGDMDSNNNTQYKQQNRVYDSEGLAISECTSPSFNPWYTEGLRIRKLTPRECWRLMGFTDEDFDKASKVCSDSRLYSQAGNSIVVDVLEAIFNQMKG